MAIDFLKVWSHQKSRHSASPLRWPVALRILVLFEDIGHRGMRRRCNL